MSISPEQFSDWDWNADPEDFVPARLCMEWTTTRPKVEGHYWVDNALCDEPELVYVTQGYYDLVVFRAEHWTETIQSERFRRWYGPLTPPPFDPAK